MILIPFQENGGKPAREACLDAELLASYIDGRTTPEERTTVEAHVAQCEDCYFAFSETVRALQAQPTDNAGKIGPPSDRWRRWLPLVASGLAAAAALVIVLQIYGPGAHVQSKDSLQVALSELDAAAGPYRRVEPRLTITTTYRQLEPALRSAVPPAEPPLALREAALQVEMAARANGPGVAEQRALAAMYLTTGRPQRAAEVLAPMASSRDAGQLNDLAAALLALSTDDDVGRARDLLERAVRLDPNRVEAWFNLGLAAERSGQPDRAMEAWTRALALDSTSGWAGEARAHLVKLKTK
jgi:tetratricopeptide (TPR) repeat protein